MNLPNDIARCDGLLPKQVRFHDSIIPAWSIDCPVRERCARYRQLVSRDPESMSSHIPFVAHFHAATEPCPDFIEEGEGEGADDDGNG